MSFEVTTVTVWHRNPTLDGMGGEIENPTSGNVYGPATGYRVTRNFHRRNDKIKRQEETAAPTMGPGVMTRTLEFFTFEPCLPDTETMTVSDYLDDGIRFRVIAIMPYDRMTQVDVERIQ